MRIGIRPALNGSWGGIYQYSLSTLRAAEEMSVDRFTLVCDDPVDPALCGFRERGWTIIATAPPRNTSVAARAIRKALGSSKPDIGEWWRQNDIGLMLYPAPTPLSFEAGVPFVVSVHDIQHRLQPEFLEVTHDGEWERREYLYRNCGGKATAILVDSEVGRQQYLSFYRPYGVTPERVKVLPFVPASYVGETSDDKRRLIAAKYRLPLRYLLYPGQFWPHKNHARVIQALERLKLCRGLEIPLVCSGSHSGEVRERQFELLQRMAADCGVAEQIVFTGYVPDEDMAALYAGAVALVMPTLFGPTNIPPLEAWASRCPVLTSDIDGMREQMGDAAVLVDPRSVEAIADGVERLWTNPALRADLIERGCRRVSLHTPAEFRDRLSAVLSEALRCPKA